MDWLQIISAVGVGALLTKVLDIVWLQKSLQEAEKRKWFREQRLRVYSKLAEELISLGKSKGARTDAFVGYALAAEAMLLVDNEQLANDIECFFTMLANVFAEGCKLDDEPTKKSEEMLEGAYRIVAEESRRLVRELRNSLRENTNHGARLE
jgi:hypothetical protein